jgi:hypothetical protein
VSEAGDAANAPFFDIEDEYYVTTDLWLIASVSIELMDLAYGVNTGQNVVEFIPQFGAHLHRIARDNDILLAEMKSTVRYKRAMEKMHNLPDDGAATRSE